MLTSRLSENKVDIPKDKVIKISIPINGVSIITFLIPLLLSQIKKTVINMILCIVNEGKEILKSIVILFGHKIRKKIETVRPLIYDTLYNFNNINIIIQMITIFNMLIKTLKPLHNSA